MLEGIKEKAQQPIGPLPAYAWVVVIVGGYFGYVWLKNRNSGTTSNTATTVGATTGTAIAPSSSDISALTSQISELGNQVTDLAGKISGTSGSSGSTTSNPIGTLLNDPAIRLIDPQTGVTIVPTSTSYNLGPLTDLKLGKSDYGLGYSVVQNGKSYILLARNITVGAATTSASVSSSAIQQLSPVASTPAFSNNTATPTSVTGITSAITSNVRVPSIPTISNENIGASSLKIVATTPTTSIVPKTIKAPVVSVGNKGSTIKVS